MVRAELHSGADLGIAEDHDPLGLRDHDFVLVRQDRDDSTRYFVTLQTPLAGESLTAFLDAVAPYGCPPPSSLIRAYVAPDAPFPSVVIKEHLSADGIGETFREFERTARKSWLAALAEEGPGLQPSLAWETGADRTFLSPDELIGSLRAAGIPVLNPPDSYLGRGLALYAAPDISAGWQDIVPLSGIMKPRKITGREFPIWVALPQHQPALLASPLVKVVEALLA